MDENTGEGVALDAAVVTESAEPAPAEAPAPVLDVRSTPEWSAARAEVSRLEAELDAALAALRAIEDKEGN